ncbi:Lipid A biosynthesis-like protein [Candidatus Rhodobacter oscarellae]|uniref:Lipid A biosynthesis-like protein n=1 Tax=Candidatus Rhodobacter oscarellae TaxID=1675527 RepID=A0A0J9EB02_9RHOB|nr:lipid-A-disaccharide synthase N-terminal domain-containing protein [Candidatus Rhodobacter lobularis]KMW58854.1 Lipid A biosynthesis-like protein [Candidatus Rhodobacter lobularis]
MQELLFSVLLVESGTEAAWVLFGLTAQLLFAGRMLVQWFASEREKKSVVPVAFWWLSIVGGLMLFAYGIWRQDLVIILGQSLGVVVYARNLWFIYGAQRDG